MKKIYTSNYRRCGSNPNAIAISYIVPDWYEGRTLGMLAPTPDMISKIKKDVHLYTYEDYTTAYLNLLEEREVFPDWLVDDLSDGAILLCYEDPGDFCHRRVLAEWIEKHTGIIVPEWKTEEELKAEEQNKVVDSMVDF